MTDERVDKYISAVKRRITEDYGGVPEEWSAQLQQLEDLYLCYLKAADKQRKRDVATMINDGKTECKTVYLTVMLDCVSAMKKVIAEFGLSPRAKSMIRGNQAVADDDFSEKFLAD